MLQVNPFDRSLNRSTRFARFAATLCVLGLVGTLWLHAGTAPDASPASASQTPSSAFLHAPTTDSSVPSAESVLGNTPPASVEEMPPTF